MQPFDKRVLRAYVANRYIRGEGIEIGALGTPLNVPAGVKVHYVDRMSKADLYREYPEMQGRALVDVAIVDNGEKLDNIPDNSVDFIVANHFMEHCEDFIGTIALHSRKIRRGGRLFYAIPNRQHTFDRNRPNTTFEHLVQDHEQGTVLARKAHFLEWSTLVQNKVGAEAEAYAEEIEKSNYSIHFHAWDARALFHCLGASVEYMKFPGFVAHFEQNGHELICLLVKE